jgi:hypothetical protein
MKDLSKYLKLYTKKKDSKDCIKVYKMLLFISHIFLIFMIALPIEIRHNFNNIRFHLKFINFRIINNTNYTDVIIY